MFSNFLRQRGGGTGLDLRIIVRSQEISPPEISKGGGGLNPPPPKIHEDEFQNAKDFAIFSLKVQFFFS